MGLLSWFGGATQAVDQGITESVSNRHASKLDQAQQLIQDKYVEAYVLDLKSQVCDKCFHKCFDPSKSDKPIDTSENGCYALCSDRYLDAFDHVRRTLQSRSRR